MTEEVIIPDVFGATTFCDDIRFEADGKVTLVGTYGGDLFIRGEFPSILPKLGIALLFVQKKEFYSNKLEMKVYLPGDPADKPAVNYDLSQVALPIPDPRPDSKFIIIRANLIFSPLPINGPGHIKVRVMKEGIAHGVGSIRVEASPEEGPHSPNPSSV